MDSCQLKKLGEKDSFLSEGSDRLSCLPKPNLESFADYVSRIIREKGLSHEKVAQRAKRLGWDLSAGSVNSIIQGHTKSARLDTFYALSLGLGEPVENLISRYLQQMLPDTPGFRKAGAYALYLEIGALENEQDRQEAKALIEVIRGDIQRRTAKS